MNKHAHAETRTERDYVGEVAIPGDKLYGVNTVRGVENLTVSPLSIAHYLEFRAAFAQCKWAAALANRDNDVVSPQQCDAIVRACQEVIDGPFDDSLIVDLLEGSGGTSTNMNFNEVIANRAQQHLGHVPGSYDVIHLNDQVNRSQSTNDVYPAALKIETYAMLGPLVTQVEKLAAQFDSEAMEFADVLHLGRTCLQDAQPMRLGQLFGGYASLTYRLAEELVSVRDKLRTLPLGGTAAPASAHRRISIGCLSVPLTYRRRGIYGAVEPVRRNAEYGCVLACFGRTACRCSVSSQDRVGSDGSVVGSGGRAGGTASSGSASGLVDYARQG